MFSLDDFYSTLLTNDYNGNHLKHVQLIGKFIWNEIKVISFSALIPSPFFMSDF